MMIMDKVAISNMKVIKVKDKELIITHQKGLISTSNNTISLNMCRVKEMLQTTTCTSTEITRATHSSITKINLINNMAINSNN